MKRYLILVALILIQGCSSGSDDAPATSSDTVFTLFDMYVVKAGVSENFTLSGSDTTGATYTGTLSITDRGITTFMSQTVMQTDFLVSLTSNSGGTFSTSGSVFGDTTTRAVLFNRDNDDGVTCTATSSSPIPATAKPGDFGSLSSLTCSDGSTESGNWRLEADTGGLAKIIFTFNYFDQFGSSDGTEQDSFTIDTGGNVSTTNLKFTDTSGLVLTLNGS